MAAQTGDRRLDTHQHFWTLERVERGDYPWMPEGGPLREDYLPERLDLERANVGGVIAVQAAQLVDETRFLLGLARDTGAILGVTGWVPLDRPDAIDTLRELARDENLRAIRAMVEYPSDPDSIDQPQIRQNLRRFTQLGLRFEFDSLPRNLPSCYRVLADIPELPALIDHLSKPTYRWDDDGEWRTWMSRLAELPNTYCKLSGMPVEVGPNWTASDFEPYANFVFEIFGADRVMFGSDWPVERQVAEYQDIITLTNRLVSPLAPDDADAVWRRNAERFYGVQVAVRR